jgi:hypothetical protein
MEEQNISSKEQQLGDVTAARLAKLRSMPVDTSRLDRLIQSEISRPSERGVLRISRWSRSLRAVAAIFLVVGVVGAILYSLTGGAVVASPAEMAQFHDDMVSGRVAVTHVTSIEDANKTLAAEWAESPEIPKVPMDHVMACCMRSVKDRKVACVLLEDRNNTAEQSATPVTLTVAKASDMEAPRSPTVIRDGVTYHIQTVGQLNMVMTERNDRWICLIAALPKERLMDLASGLGF